MTYDSLILQLVINPQNIKLTALQVLILVTYFACKKLQTIFCSEITKLVIINKIIQKLYLKPTDSYYCTELDSYTFTNRNFSSIF